MRKYYYSIENSEWLRWAKNFKSWCLWISHCLNQAMVLCLQILLPLIPYLFQCLKPGFLHWVIMLWCLSNVPIDSCIININSILVCDWIFWGQTKVIFRPCFTCIGQYEFWNPSKILFVQWRPNIGEDCTFWPWLATVTIIILFNNESIQDKVSCPLIGVQMYSRLQLRPFPSLPGSFSEILAPCTLLEVQSPPRGQSKLLFLNLIWTYFIHCPC